MTTDDAKTKSLRRPTLSESGPETMVAIRMPTRLMRPSTGMTVAGVLDAEVVGEQEELVAGDGEVARVEQQATGERPEEVGVLDRVDPERAEEVDELERLGLEVLRLSSRG